MALATTTIRLVVLRVHDDLQLKEQYAGAKVSGNILTIEKLPIMLRGFREDHSYLADVTYNIDNCQCDFHVLDVLEGMRKVFTCAPREWQIGFGGFSYDINNILQYPLSDVIVVCCELHPSVFFHWEWVERQATQPPFPAPRDPNREHTRFRVDGYGGGVVWEHPHKFRFF